MLISELQLSDLEAPIRKFYSLCCDNARNVVAGFILDEAIRYFTNKAEMTLQEGSLLVFQFDYDSTNIHIHFDANKLHFLLKNALVLKPGEVKTLSLQIFTNTQVVSELSCELSDDFALAPDLQFVPQLSVQHVNLVNCSEETIEGRTRCLVL